VRPPFAADSSVVDGYVVQILGHRTIRKKPDQFVARRTHRERLPLVADTFVDRW